MAQKSNISMCGDANTVLCLALVKQYVASLPNTPKMIYLQGKLYPYEFSIQIPLSNVCSSEEIPLKWQLSVKIDKASGCDNAIHATITANLLNLPSNLPSETKKSFWVIGTMSIFSSHLDKTISGSFQSVSTSEQTTMMVNFTDNTFVYKDKACPRDYINILCEIDAYEIIAIQPMISTDFSSAKHVLLNDMHSLYNNDELCDFVIRVKEKEFGAHKAILGIRSPVFASMFQQDMLEKNKNCLEITDFDIQAIEEMLRFLYTGECKLDNDIADDLLSLSDKYDIDSLKSVCEDFLITNISVETVLRILNLADLHGALKLTENCVDFICDHASDIIATDSWKSFVKSRPDLIVKVFEATVKRQKSPVKS